MPGYSIDKLIGSLVYSTQSDCTSERNSNDEIPRNFLDQIVSNVSAVLLSIFSQFKFFFVFTFVNTQNNGVL